MTNKERYKKLCLEDKTIPLFSRSWWLDAVCGDNWDVVLVEKGGQIVASLPYYLEKRKNMTYIMMPKLTQTLGVWMKYPPKQKYVKKLSFEREVMKKLIKQLPKFDYFKQNFHHSITNWLPFYWEEFEQTTRYTYRIEDLSDLDAVFKYFKDSMRRDIKKANELVRVEETEDIELFYSINKLTFERQNINIPYNLDYLKRLDSACKEKNSRKILIAKDNDGRIHSALYLVWDENSAYYIMSGSDPELRSSNAMSLLIWEAIQFSASVSNSFDFEGSMIEPIERFFASMGAAQVPFHQITKKNSKVLKMKESLQSVLKK
ncbi:GNAT family N-acetyltransferase [Mangrovibacillus sp. Mu-81]|uniref:GNAT family N-acetyltransferase n=1 Tax=Mangrovibacillus sp. Mu-81 TaxID=3121478 RepID=UPI002FE4B1F9